MRIFKQFTFDSAHFLPNVPPGQKCREIHGHTYRLLVHVEGDLDKKLDWVMDFADLKKAVDPIVKRLDHQLLNNIEGLENPLAKPLPFGCGNTLNPNCPFCPKLSCTKHSRREPFMAGDNATIMERLSQ